MEEGAEGAGPTVCWGGVMIFRADRAPQQARRRGNVHKIIAKLQESRRVDLK
jgi:hypothetical protein